MAGLNFVGNAVYQEVDEAEDGKENVCQYELIPWILSSVLRSEKSENC